GYVSALGRTTRCLPISETQLACSPFHAQDDKRCPGKENSNLRVVPGPREHVLDIVDIQFHFETPDDLSSTYRNLSLSGFLFGIRLGPTGSAFRQRSGTGRGTAGFRAFARLKTALLTFGHVLL